MTKPEVAKIVNKKVRFHMENGDPCEASSVVDLLLKNRLGLSTRKALEKIKDEIDLGTPEKVEHHIDYYFR